MTEPSQPQGPYGRDFYAWHREGTSRSAGVIVPMLMELFNPRSVVDVGCGEGLWLSAFQQCGVHDLSGIDGSWARPEWRSHSGIQFVGQDLAGPIELNRRFDVALCLEVVEHLPLAAGTRLIAELARLAPVIVFSAAVPFQGGEGHVNEQWSTHWIALFAAQGFESVSNIRGRIWGDERVEFWYRQNMRCFVTKSETDLLRRLRSDESASRRQDQDIIHPELYLYYCRAFEHHKAEVDRLETMLAHKNEEVARARNEINQMRDELVSAREELDALRWAAAQRTESSFEEVAHPSLSRLSRVARSMRQVRSFFRRGPHLR